jgi:ribosome-binding protein aMBF1 (putative translation factor)
VRLLGFELSEEWQQTVRLRTPKHRHQQSQSHAATSPEYLLSSDINAARRYHNLTQRALANRLSKSQSWIRDIAKGWFNINAEDLALLLEVFGYQD